MLTYMGLGSQTLQTPIIRSDPYEGYEATISFRGRAFEVTSQLNLGMVYQSN